MEIKITYIGTLNGINGFWCGFKPDGAIIQEERNVLFPTTKNGLKNKITLEEDASFWIKDGDSIENYEEVDLEEEIDD